jgi:hypothetical protein
MEYNSDFRYDLKRGQKAEKWLGGLLEADTLEVKRDFITHKTKRVFVEYECNGKPSGIRTTEADWWGFVLDDSAVMISTEKLTLLVNDAIAQKRYRRGGDGNKSLGALVRLQDLVEYRYTPPTTTEESTDE